MVPETELKALRTPGAMVGQDVVDAYAWYLLRIRGKRRAVAVAPTALYQFLADPETEPPRGWMAAVADLCRGRRWLLTLALLLGRQHFVLIVVDLETGSLSVADSGGGDGDLSPMFLKRLAAAAPCLVRV